MSLTLSQTDMLGERMDERKREREKKRVMDKKKKREWAERDTKCTFMNKNILIYENKIVSLFQLTRQG
jgi:hypothetical protein